MLPCLILLTCAAVCDCQTSLAITLPAWLTSTLTHRHPRTAPDLLILFATHPPTPSLNRWQAPMSFAADASTKDAAQMQASAILARIEQAKNKGQVRHSSMCHSCFCLFKQQTLCTIGAACMC